MTTVAAMAPALAPVRVLLAGAEPRVRMHLRRLLADCPSILIAGHARADALIGGMMHGDGTDMLIIDAFASQTAALETLRAVESLRMGVVVLTGEQPFSPDGEGGRVQVVRRPDNLETLPSQSPFAQALRTALTRRSTPRPYATVAAPVRGPAVAPRPALIAIGSSTGGPAALPEVLRPLGDRITQPIVITQHMPAAFSQILVEHLGRHTPMPTVLAADGMPLLPGRIHVAPGGRHLLLVRQGEQIMCRLDDGPPESFCKPAVDPMLRSIIAIYGARTLAIILTGMGQDGLLGCRALVAAGGTVLAQDEATSVVWGMPGAVAQAGLCQSVLPLKEIGKAVLKVAGGGS